jgi:hypothetical protein
MPHTPATAVTIVKKDGGGEAGPMQQPQAESYLGNLLNKDCLANLKQAMNDVFSGKGKASGAHTFAGQPVLHASSGNGQKSVTLFYYMFGSTGKIFAMGEHEGSSSYSVSYYGQRGTSFQHGRTIALP